MPDPVIYRSIVEGSADLVVAFDDEGTIVFANEASVSLIGHPPADLVGRQVFEFIHADDLERAMLALDLNVTFGSAPGTTVFRLAHRDGSWVFVDVTGGHATDDGERVLFSSFSRKADDQFAITETLMRLLDGSSVADALRPVLDIFAWERNGSQIGISWIDEHGAPDAISTGITLELVGRSDGEDAWAVTRRSGERFMDLELAHLTAPHHERAVGAGMGSYWIEPVGSGEAERALITVWTRPGARPPLNHASAMATVKPIVEVILRWVEQQRLLDFAAFHDPLTGLANRKRFFETLHSCAEAGSILYCDLDRFKAVNDELGHAVGDELLKLVSARLLQCVRTEDLVARLGGDEFAVLCPGATREMAAEIGQRIEAALTRSFSIGGNPVTVGVSIGVSHAEGQVGDDTLESADEALYRIKAGRRSSDGPR